MGQELGNLGSYSVFFFFFFQELLIKGFSETGGKAEGMLRYCTGTKDSTLNRERLPCRELLESTASYSVFIPKMRLPSIRRN